MIPALNRYLDFDSSLNCFYRTGELGKNVVARCIDNAALMALDNASDCGTVLFKRIDSRSLVIGPPLAVADNIRAQNY